MKIQILLLTVLLCSLLLQSCGCATQVSSDDLISDAEIIDAVSVGFVVDEGEHVNVDIRDEVRVNLMLDMLKNLEVEEISVDRAKAIHENADIWPQKAKYQISLIATNEHDRFDSNEALKGFVLLLEERNLLFVEPKTMNPFEDGQIEKNTYYISEEVHPENIIKMAQIIIGK